MKVLLFQTFLVLLLHLLSLDANEYEYTMKDYLWANTLANTVTNYQQRAWHRWKIKEAAAAAAANQRVQKISFILNTWFNSRVKLFERNNY